MWSVTLILCNHQVVTSNKTLCIQKYFWLYTCIYLYTCKYFCLKDYVYFSFIKLEHCVHNISEIGTDSWHEIWFWSLGYMEGAIKWSSLCSDVCNLRIWFSEWPLCEYLNLFRKWYHCAYNNTNAYMSFLVLWLQKHKWTHTTVAFKATEAMNNDTNNFQNQFRFLNIVFRFHPVWIWIQAGTTTMVPMAVL